MGWLQDAVDFNTFNVGDSLKRGFEQFQDNPVENLIGPPTWTRQGSSLWGALTDKDYGEPTLNVYGGPSTEQFRRGEAEGINTRPAQVEHGIASLIAQYYGGQALGGAAGMGYDWLFPKETAASGIDFGGPGVGYEAAPPAAPTNTTGPGGGFGGGNVNYGDNPEFSQTETEPYMQREPEGSGIRPGTQAPSLRIPASTSPDPSAPIGHGSSPGLRLPSGLTEVSPGVWVQAGSAAAGGGLPTSEQVPAGGGQQQMPPAQPLDPEALKAMGLIESSPGVWEAVPPPEPVAPPPVAPTQAPLPTPAPPPVDAGLQMEGGDAFNVEEILRKAGASVGEGLSAAGKSLGKQFVKNPLGTATTGLALTKALQSGGEQSAATQQQEQLAAQAAGVSKELLARYKSGQLQPGQQASLDQQVQAAKNQINNYFANAGLAGSTAHVQALAQVDQQAVVMKQQMLDNMLSQGLNAIGVAAGPLKSVAAHQLGQDQALTQAFGNFASAVGNMSGRTAGTTQPQQPQNP